jgi:hypothetical protein
MEMVPAPLVLTVSIILMHFTSNNCWINKNIPQVNAVNRIEIRKMASNVRVIALGDSRSFAEGAIVIIVCASDARTIGEHHCCK